MGVLTPRISWPVPVGAVPDAVVEGVVVAVVGVTAVVEAVEAEAVPGWHWE
jgi:hypothetical protein